MKSIRHIALTAMLTVGSFSAITYTSCTKDDCRDVICWNGGTCTDGFCTCPTGFSGENCQIILADQFPGVYIGKDMCKEATDEYAVSIYLNPTNQKLTISNLYNTNFSAFATLESAGLLRFEGISMGTTYSGTATLSGDQITINYTITDGTVTDNCVFTGTSR